MKRIFGVIALTAFMAAAVSCSCRNGSSGSTCPAEQCAGCSDKDSCSSSEAADLQDCDHVCDSTSVNDAFYK